MVPMSRMYHMAVQWNQSCFQNPHKIQKCRPIFFQDKYYIYQISHLPKVLVLASAGQTDEEEFQNFILNCDPYYKRHLQKLPESKHKSSAPEIEEELKTAFELYSNVCEYFFQLFFLFSLIISLCVFSTGAISALAHTILKNRLGISKVS